jgi:hypothetical protein
MEGAGNGPLIEVGNGSEHELVKKRDGKCHVAMSRAVDHAFLDELPERLTSSGGGEPAPGENGFLMGSIRVEKVF